MNKRDLTDYYEKDVPAYASYDNLRKLCGIDGLKLSQRKIIYAAFKRCYDNWIKTDTMSAQVQIDTNYVHGAANLEQVIDNLATNYVGANNYSLLTGNSGGFGCRISPRPSAGRYTRITMSDITKKIFLDIDNNILEKQYFEGQYIEPKYLIPIFPIMFLNGSHGLSTGFSQDIYPRNPIEIIEYIKKKISGIESPRMKLLPWFKGHLGKVEYNPELQKNESFGVITKNNTTSYTITELPIGIEYQKYCNYLDTLCENGTIQDYDDQCDPKTDKILFNIKTTREFTKKHTNERKLFECFKLIKSLPETLNCIDENNRVKEFSSITEILDEYINIRLKFYQKRKDWLLKNIRSELEKLSSKYLFIKGIVENTIIINKKTKEDIVKQLEKNEKIFKINGNYDYLLALPIHSLTKEKMEELKKQISDKKELFIETKNKTIEQMWLDDLHEFKKTL